MKLILIIINLLIPIVALVSTGGDFRYFYLTDIVMKVLPDTWLLSEGSGVPESVLVDVVSIGLPGSIYVDVKGKVVWAMFIATVLVPWLTAFSLYRYGFPDLHRSGEPTTLELYRRILRKKVLGETFQ